jgi:hypothetical protein
MQVQRELSLYGSRVYFEMSAKTSQVEDTRLLDEARVCLKFGYFAGAPRPGHNFHLNAWPIYGVTGKARF